MRLFGPVELPMEHRILRLLLAGGLLIGITALFFVKPADLPFTCLFHSITGHSCLTCGMTRSLHAISHGDWIASFRYHLFGPLIFAGMLLCLAASTAEAIRGRRLSIRIGVKTGSRILVIVIVFMFVYWGARLAAEFAA